VTPWQRGSRPGEARRPKRLGVPAYVVLHDRTLNCTGAGQAAKPQSVASGGWDGPREGGKVRRSDTGNVRGQGWLGSLRADSLIRAPLLPPIAHPARIGNPLLPTGHSREPSITACCARRCDKPAENTRWSPAAGNNLPRAELLPACAHPRNSSVHCHTLPTRSITP
jgi:hypothetical protein